GEETEPAAPHALIAAARARGAPERIEPPSRVAAGASHVGLRGRELASLARGATPPLDLAPRVHAELARAAFFLDPEAASGPVAGSVGKDARARARLAAAVGGASAEDAIAVTTIENAAECAFLGFARRVLRVRRAEDVGESADARERGTLVHRAL